MPTLSIASWNVNSIRVRLPQVLNWLETNPVDVLAVQETKVPDKEFPVAEINAAGYQVTYSGQKTYNGVAILSKTAATDIVKDINGLDDTQRRILGVTIQNLRILNLYVVNGSEVGSEKYVYKLKWLAAVTNYLEKELARYPRYVVLGDFNIAPEDIDVHDPEAWHEQILCSSREREALTKLMKLGFEDSFRLLHKEGGQFSWWDYRAGGFRRNLGLRIDLILIASGLREKLIGSSIDTQPRKWERPSDHAPAVVQLSI